MMMMINEVSQSLHSPYYLSSATTMSTSAPMTTFGPCRTVMPLPSTTTPMTMPIPTPMLPSNPSPTKKRRCRRVAFGPDETLAYIETALEFTQQDKDDRWYRPSEMESFKQTARNLCHKRMHNSKNNIIDTAIPRHSDSTDRNAGVTSSVVNTKYLYDEEDSIRGMDVYYSARQRYCKKFIQHVLEAYYVRCVGNDEHVALLAEKWSVKSQKRAITAGMKDFYVAYFPEECEYESMLYRKEMLLSTITMRQQQPQQQEGLVKILATPA